MPDFNLPSGCRMRFSASMEKEAVARHRWSVALSHSDDAPGSDPRAQYGALIKSGETQRLDPPAIAADCICRVAAMVEADGGWSADLGEVIVATPNDVTMVFSRPGESGTLEKCVLAFELIPLAA
jgi:hypothetical protein